MKDWDTATCCRLAVGAIFWRNKKMCDVYGKEEQGFGIIDYYGCSADDEIRIAEWIRIQFCPFCSKRLEGEVTT